MPRSVSTVINKDWFGSPVAAGPRFELSLDDAEILLRASAANPPILVPGDIGGYTEGLWNGDCVELFLVNPTTGYYIEFNLSPKGGRWSCEFTAPRVRALGAPRDLPGVTTTAKLTGREWASSMRIPVASLPKELAFDPSKTLGNVTFCLGDSPRRYLTYADLGVGAPDFHRPDQWVKLWPCP